MSSSLFEKHVPAIFTGICFLFLSFDTFSKDLKIPKIHVEWGALADNRCKSITGKGFQHDIQPGVDYHTGIMKEANALSPVIQKLWDTEGEQLLQIMINMVGREYSKNELIVYTSACRSGGISTPFSVGLRPYLKTVRLKPKPKKELVTLIFHEFIHRYLVDSFNYGQSKILQEFDHAPSLIKIHLHHMALKYAVLKKANRQDLIDAYIHPKKISKPYNRAWKLATSEKYHSRLLAEIKEMAGGNDNYWFFDSKI